MIDNGDLRCGIYREVRPGEFVREGDLPDRPKATELPKTLRDEFAMAAMQALVSDPLTRGVSDKAEIIATTSYAVADAMLAARQAKGE